jgi:hypothetical protein
MLIQYSINFPASITLLNNTNQTFNLTTFINAVARLAGCGGCSNVSLNPTTCGACKVLYTYNSSIPAVFRRLLSSGSVVQVDTTVVTNDKNKADTAMASINSNSLNSELTKLSNSNAGTVSVTKPPLLTTQVVSIAPPPPPPPVNPPEPIKPTPTTSESTPSNVGAIAGGAVGGVVGLGLIAILIWYFTKGTQRANSPPATSTKSVFTYKQREKGVANQKLSTRFVYVRRS